MLLAQVPAHERDGEDKSGRERVEQHLARNSQSADQLGTRWGHNSVSLYGSHWHVDEIHRVAVFPKLRSHPSENRAQPVVGQKTQDDGQQRRSSKPPGTGRRSRRSDPGCLCLARGKSPANAAAVMLHIQRAGNSQRSEPGQGNGAIASNRPRVKHASMRVPPTVVATRRPGATRKTTRQVLSSRSRFIVLFGGQRK